MLVNETTWAVVDLSDRQKRMLRRWKKDGSNSLSLKFYILGIMTLLCGGCMTLGFGMLVLDGRLGWPWFTVCAAVTFFVGPLTTYVGHLPSRRTALREQLHCDAKVLTDEDLAFRLLRPVLHRANKVPNGRECVSALMITMHGYRAEYGERWHISSNVDARNAWLSVIKTSADSPLSSLIAMFVCENDLRRNFDQVLETDRRAYIEQLTATLRHHESTVSKQMKDLAVTQAWLDKVENEKIYNLSKLPS